MEAQDSDYFLRRALEEDEAASRASTLTARWRHEELASLYRMRARQLQPDGDEPPSVVPAFILTPADTGETS